MVVPPIAPPAPPRRHRVPFLAAVAAVLLLVGGALVAFLLTRGDRRQPVGSGASGPTDGGVEIGIAYGTEKKKWLTDAAQKFQETEEGKDVRINLLPHGSLEGAEAVCKKEDPRIHVWAPASSLTKDTLVRRWQKKHGGNPILKEEVLALTPVVFVLWQDRYRALVKKYGEVSFAAVARAMKDGDGEPFRFRHTDPARSNSGLMTLALMACEYHKTRRLVAANVADAGFQAWLKEFEAGLPQLSHSTGALMEDMARRGPTAYDALFVYENVVIDYFEAAQRRWGELHVAYPARNLWSDNPYYILDVPWSSPRQRQAAGAFLRFLMSEPSQREALRHGFRPGNVNVPVKDTPDSPFVLHPNAGLRVEVKSVVETPGDEVIDGLLTVWEKARRAR
jgi:hypothetical protein